MNLNACGSLHRGPKTRVWYRAIEARFWATALQTDHTRGTYTRFNPGTAANKPFETLYLCEDHQLALLEVEGLLGSSSRRSGGVFVPNPQSAWTILNAQVCLQQIADLTKI